MDARPLMSGGPKTPEPRRHLTSSSLIFIRLSAAETRETAMTTSRIKPGASPV